MLGSSMRATPTRTGTESVIVWNAAGDAYVSLDSGDDAVAGNKGLYFVAAGDEDIEIINLSVSGTPRLFWDESDNAFTFNLPVAIAPGKYLDVSTTGGVFLQYATFQGASAIIKGSTTSGLNITTNTLTTDATARDLTMQVLDTTADAFRTVITLQGGAGETLGKLGFFGRTPSSGIIDARIDDTVNSGDATTDGVIDAIRDAMVAYGLVAAA